MIDDNPLFFWWDSHYYRDNWQATKGFFHLYHSLVCLFFQQITREYDISQINKILVSLSRLNYFSGFLRISIGEGFFFHWETTVKDLTLRHDWWCFIYLHHRRSSSGKIFMTFYTFLHNRDNLPPLQRSLVCLIPNWLHTIQISFSNLHARYFL